MKQFDEIIKEHAAAVSSLKEAEVREVANAILECYKNGGKVLLFGNGGSAADAQHIAAELVCKFRKERRSLPAIALTTNTSALTAVSNDYSYEKAFARQVEGLASNGDVVIGISTSGKSKNVLLALKEAKGKGAKTVAFSGRTKMPADISVTVDSADTPRIQEAHITAGHIICEIVEDNL